MTQTKKPPAPRGPRYKTEPALVGFAHNSHFDDNGVSTGAIGEQELARLKDAFPGVEFTKIEEPKAVIGGASKTGDGESVK